jgi:tRNA A37 threonylcarbamoyladenosine synthetase subunit TsaC/SUA5/YrdC
MVSEREIEHAVAVLRAGGLVAFPTETVMVSAQTRPVRKQ